MNKADLIDCLVDKMEMTHGKTISKSDVDALLKSLGDVTQKVLAHPAEITLPGIGKLSTGERAARKGRNPQTGQEIDLPATKIVRFKPVKALKDAINQ